MNTEEARQLLLDHLNEYLLRPYDQLRGVVGSRRRETPLGNSGTRYQLVLDVYWDDKPDGDIRISGHIDDGGWRAFLPLSECLLIEPPT